MLLLLGTKSCLTLCNPGNCSLPDSSLSMGFPRQEYWSGLPFPPPGDLPDPRTTAVSVSSLQWQVGSLPLAPPRKLLFVWVTPQFTNSELVLWKVVQGLFICILWASQVARVVKNLPANAGDVREAGSIPGLGRSPGGGNGNPLQYSCLENPMDRGALWATVHRVAKSQTRLK